MARPRPRGPREGGYLLVPVVVMLTLIIAAVYTTTLQGSIGIESTSRAREAREALLTARAGVEHAIYEANSSSCTNYSLATTPFGAHSYDVTFDPTSSSPIAVTSTATLASGVTRSVTRTNVPVYETATEILFIQPGPEGKDASINAAKSDENHGADDIIEIEPNGVAHGLFEFDVSGLPASTVVRSAKLELFVLAGFNSEVEVRRMTRAWVEGSCVGEGPPCPADGTTWDSFDGTNAWNQNGGDYDPIVVSRATPQFAGAWLEFDVTALVSAWHSGVPNHGVTLNTSSQWIEFAGGDYADASVHPKLTIEYSCQCDPGSISNQIVLQPGPGFGIDTVIRGDSAFARNYGSAPDLVVSPSVPFHALLAFDLSSLPSNAIISNAELEVFIDGFDGLPLGEIDVHRVTTAWTEGSGGNAGLIPADGATWDTTDGATPWASFGGDYDPVALDSASVIAVLSFIPAWYDWDVTPAVAAWQRGTQPNFGFVFLRGSGLIPNAYIVSSDDPSAGLRPKLTLTYGCPCGAPCSTPIVVGGDLLMVVGDVNNLTPQETQKRALMQSWEFTVTLIEQDESLADFETALAAHDVVFVSEDVDAGDIDTKLSASPIGVVTEEADLSDELGLAGTIVWTSGSSVEIVDTDHPITSPYSAGSLTLFSASEALAYPSGATSSDLSVLATTDGGNDPLIVTLEQGDVRWDELALIDSRRVQLPWGGDNFDAAHFNDDGRTVFRRALQWAATKPSPPGGYLDRFVAPTCDPAIDSHNSDGSLDWSDSPWVESEGDDYCSGDAQVELLDYSYRMRLEGDVEITRAVDLSSFPFATLRFRYRLDGTADPTRFVAVETSDNGGGDWTEIGRIERNPMGKEETIDLPISTAMTADSQIRFRAVHLGGTEFWLDNLTIVEEETILPFVCGINYVDSVLSRDYDGSDGSLTWSTDWLEINEFDGARNGDIQALSFDGGHVLQIKDNGGGGEGFQREADLSSTTKATLNFQYQRDGFDNANDYVLIGASSDGGANWTTIASIGGAGSDATFVDASLSLDAFLSDETRIAFQGSPTLGNFDILRIDNVEICLEPDPSAAP